MLVHIQPLLKIPEKLINLNVPIPSPISLCFVSRDRTFNEVIQSSSNQQI